MQASWECFGCEYGKITCAYTLTVNCMVGEAVLLFIFFPLQLLYLCLWLWFVRCSRFQKKKKTVAVVCQFGRNIRAFVYIWKCIVFKFDCNRKNIRNAPHYMLTVNHTKYSILLRHSHSCIKLFSFSNSNSMLRTAVLRKTNTGAFQLKIVPIAHLQWEPTQNQFFPFTHCLLENLHFNYFSLWNHEMEILMMRQQEYEWAIEKEKKITQKTDYCQENEVNANKESKQMNLIRNNRMWMFRMDTVCWRPSHCEINTFEKKRRNFIIACNTTVSCGCSTFMVLHDVW